VLPCYTVSIAGRCLGRKETIAETIGVGYPLAMASLIRQSDGSVLTLDGVLAVVHRPSLQVTEHPIEDGTSISDAVIERPLQISADLLVSGSPLDPTGTASSGATRMQEARAWLDNSRGEALTFLSDRFGDFTDLALVDYAHEETQIEKVVFGCTLQAVITVQASSIEVPEAIAASPGLASATDSGTASATEDEQASATAAAAERSALSSLLGV